MTPARLRDRCAAPGCQQARSSGAALCDDHIYGRRRWQEGTRPTCNVSGCNRTHHARGLCGFHYGKFKRSADFTRVRLSSSDDSPYYADRPCPSCGDRRTVPFDPKPEFAGRPPSSSLGTCVACGHIFSASAPCSSIDASDGSPLGPVDGHGGDTVARPPQNSHDCVPTGCGVPHNVSHPAGSARGGRNGKPELPR